ncbi:aromatic prenyltransferase [Aspergillus crustosus]
MAPNKGSLSNGGRSTPAWKVLSQTLPSRAPDADAWWQLTGRHLAVLLDAAAYPIERQYECLLYHYHYATPYLGSAPKDSASTSKWKSILQLDGTPFEFSWKWNTPDGEPDVRIGLEPIGPMAGTPLDPLNHAATREVLHKLSSAVPDVDLTWTHHFLATLFDHDYAKYTAKATQGTPIGTSLVLSLEFLRNSTKVKTYFQPRLLDQQGFLDVPRWEASFQKLHPDEPSRTALHEFLTTNPEGKLLKPFCLSLDNCSPPHARLKWYFNSPSTNFNSIRGIMTLGNRVPMTETLERQFVELFDLLRTLTSQPHTFPVSSEFPSPASTPTSDSPGPDFFSPIPNTLTGLVYFFDIAPNQNQSEPSTSLPKIKLYFPIRNHCANDLIATQNLNSWLDSRGRGQYGSAFLKSLEAIADYRRLDEGGGLLSFLSCQFGEDGGLDLTSYFNPQAFAAGREEAKGRRGVRRRGDW